LKIVLYIIWALFVASVIWAFIRTLRKTRRQERLIAIWPKVQATVTGSRQGWTSGGGNATRSVRFWPAYQFLDPRGILYVGESEVSCANRPVPGSSLEVAYNPADPNQSFQVDAPSKMVIGCLIPTFAFFALASFWFIGIFPLG
jgi:hypothetical protein